MSSTTDSSSQFCEEYYNHSQITLFPLSVPIFVIHVDRIGSFICNDDQDLFEDMNTKPSHSNPSPNSLNACISEEVNETLAQLEYGTGRHQHVLSFSNDKPVVIVDDESDYVLCKDVVQNVYNIINTIMLFFKVGMLDRISSSITFT